MVEEAVPLYLLVRPKKNLREWLLPKGHIEKGESASAAARREVREEAGVESDLVTHLGSIIFENECETFHVDFFLLKYSHEVASSEKRETQWLKQEDAEQLLSFPEAREILRKAHAYVNKRLPEPPLGI